MYNSNGAVVGTAAGGTLAMSTLAEMSEMSWTSASAFGAVAIFGGFLLARQVGKRVKAGKRSKAQT
jgi:hypothetical protein